MSYSTGTKQRDILNTQNSAEETPNSNSIKQLNEREKMEHAPFWIIGNEEEGYMGTLGKYQITERFPNKESVQQHFETEMWNMIIKIAGIVAADLIEQHEKIKEKENPLD